MTKAIGLKVKAVGVDFDDFLVVSREIKTMQHIAVARDAYGRNITREFVASVWGKGLRYEMGAYYTDEDPENISDETHLEHLNSYTARSAEFPKELIPGAKPALERIARSKLPMFMLTSLIRPIATEEMRQAGIDPDMFALVVGSDDTHPLVKPDPAVFDSTVAMLQGLGITPGHTLYGGDALSDGKASEGAGMQFIGVPSGVVSSVDFARNGFTSLPSIEQFASHTLYLAGRS